MFQKNNSTGFVEIFVITIIIAVIASFNYFTFMTKDKYVPYSEIKERLSKQFQDRFVKLECVGNNQKFHYITNEHSKDEVEPENAVITFKDIQKKLCEYGKQKSCKIIEKWEHRRSSYRIASFSDEKYQKERLKEVFNELFAKKYYKRFCDNNSLSSACDELEKLYKSD